MQLGIGLGLNRLGGRAGFQPTDISGIIGWWDASDLTTITQSGGLVSQWDDKSGNGNHAVQATGASQLATGVETLNGMNVLSNPVRGTFMDVTTISESQPVSYVAVWTADDNGGVTDGIGASTRNQHGYASPTGFARTLFAGSQVNTFATEITFGSYLVWAAIFDGASSFAYRNGVTGSTVDPGAQNVTNGIRIMGHGTNPSAFGVVGKVAELIMYDRALTGSELVALDAYLNNKWQVYS